MHYIISLHTPCVDYDEYRKLVLMVYAALPKCDPSCKNPSRLTRTPNQLRNTGARQELLEVREKVTRVNLEDFLYYRSRSRAKRVLEARDKFKEKKMKLQDAPEEMNAEAVKELESWAEYVMENGIGRANSRHHVLVQMAVAARGKGADELYTTQLLTRVADALGILDRGDVPDIIRWAYYEAQ